jgi:uncharacterized protein YyaL (SSP411 family)
MQSEGEVYLWKQDELVRRLSEQEFTEFADTFGVSEWGNFEAGTNHLRIDPEMGGWAAGLEDLVQISLNKLRAARLKRPQPPVDDMIVASHNGLAMSAFVSAYRVFLSVDSLLADKFLSAAQSVASGVKELLWKDGILYRAGTSTQCGETRGLLEDYAYVARGLLDLYQNDFNIEHLDWALELTESITQQFGGVGKTFSHAPLESALLPPFTDFVDHGELPNAMAVCIENLLKLHGMTESNSYLKDAESMLLAVGDAAVKSAASHSQYLTALDLYMDSQVVTVLTDDQSQASEFLKLLGQNYVPQAIVVCSSGNSDHPSVLSNKALGVSVLGSESDVEYSGGFTDTDLQSALEALMTPSELRL